MFKGRLILGLLLGITIVAILGVALCIYWRRPIVIHETRSPDLAVHVTVVCRRWLPPFNPYAVVDVFAVVREEATGFTREVYLSNEDLTGDAVVYYKDAVWVGTLCTFPHSGSKLHVDVKDVLRKVP